MGLHAWDKTSHNKKTKIPIANGVKELAEAGHWATNAAQRET